MSSILSSLLPLIKPQLVKLLSNPETLQSLSSTIEKEKGKYELKSSEDDIIMYATCNSGRIVLYVASIEVVSGRVTISRHLRSYTEEDLPELIENLKLL